jgi:Alpha/beta hydrolase family
MSPTLLLVHGGGHGNPIYLTEFRAQLKKYGISSAAYRAPSESGPPTPGRAMYDDALYWREKIGTLVDAGEDVVILAHSIGSVVATEASQGLTKAERQAKGLHGGVVHLIFLAAYLSAEGDSVFTFYEKYPLPATVAFDSVCIDLLVPFKHSACMTVCLMVFLTYKQYKLSITKYHTNTGERFGQPSPV